MPGRAYTGGSTQLTRWAPGRRARSVVLCVLVAVAVPAALTLAVPAASAATRYAAPDGEGNPATCPRSDPCEIHAASGAAAAGDEVVVLPGAYEAGGETISIPNDVAVHGPAAGPRPTIRSTAPFAVFGSSNSGLRDVNVLVDPPGRDAVWSVTQVDRVHARTGGQGGIACRPDFDFAGFDDAYVRNTICISTGRDGRAVHFRHSRCEQFGFLATSLHNVTALTTGPLGVAIEVEGAAGFDNPGHPGCAAGIWGRNVIAIGALADLRAETDSRFASGAAIDLDYSAFDAQAVLVGDGTSAPAPGSAHNITAPPLFADWLALDLHQAPGSPTIDAGSSAAVQGGFDIDGQPRVQGAAADIGADELGRCGRPATILVEPGAPVRGTPGADVIAGTRARDAVRALAGNDRICTLGGADAIRAGGGSDVVDAGTGRDRVRGGHGHDTLRGGKGPRDRLLGGPGRDTLAGGPGRGDLCVGGRGRDVARRSCERVRGVP